MVSSQVGIASTSSFGCVLRDRNHREAPCRETNVKPTHHHQATFKSFVMDLNTCMSVSSDSATNENNNENNNNNNNLPKAPRNNHLERLRLTRINSSDGGNNNSETSLASLISPRHSRLLDRWAARQAREMVSNLENEAELLSMDDNYMLPRTSSSSTSDESSEVPNLGASSLVQIWEKRLNQSGVSKQNTAMEKIDSGSSPPNVAIENVEEQCFDGPSGNEESFTFPDWESSDQSVSPRGRSESDRVSVADIIKKLTSTNQNQSPTPSYADDNEHEGYGSSSVTSSPCRERECAGVSTQKQQHSEQNYRVPCPLRIRGRRAYLDLLAQMVNDRHGELNNLAERGAVSKFAQRGRIQALLRLKLLQRDAAANDPPRQKSTASEVNNRQPQGSAIMQLRAKFSSGAELRTPVQAEVANSRSPHGEIVNNTKLGKSATADQLSKDTSNQTARGTANHASESTQKPVLQNTIDRNTEEAHPPSSDVMVQETHPSSDVKALQYDSNLNETADRAETSNQQNAMAKSSNDETVNEEEASNQQYAETSYEETVEDMARNQNYAESSYDYETVDEIEVIDQNCNETNYDYDWISEISRPRSYWEERRQAWYREMLETGCQNEDIPKLLERRTVSSFLSSSDFREKMDRLMKCHRGTQTDLANSQDNAEDSQGLMAFLQERLHAASAPREDGTDVEERRNEDEEEEEEEEENADEDEEENADEHEEESLISSSYHEAGDFSNQSTSWSYRDNGDDFDRVVSTSPQPYQSQSFYQDSRRSSTTNHHPIVSSHLVLSCRTRPPKFLIELKTAVLTGNGTHI
ncbi:hypothetical protein CR513_28549, partial [Mucuna pruriens]